MYDVLIIGAGPGGIFSAYELTEKNPDMRIAIFEAGHELSRRKCPIDGEKIKNCIIGDGSGITHSLSHASASGVYVARQISKSHSWSSLRLFS